MDDDRVGRLLGVELQLLAQLDADPRRVEQLHERSPVLEVRARRVAERVSRTAVRLVADGGVHVAVGRAEAQLVAHAAVPQLGQRLGQLHGEAVELQVVAVRVRLEQLLRLSRDLRAHRDQLHGQHVGAQLGRLLLVAEEVGEAQVPASALAREREPGDLAGRVLGRPDDERLSVRVHREVAVDDAEVREAAGLDPVEPHPQPRQRLGLDELLEARAVLQRLQAPLPHERGAVVEPRRDLGELQALDDARSPERRRRHVDPALDVGAHA